MGKKLTKFLNILTFGHLGRKAKKEAAKQAQTSNVKLTLDTVSLPDVSILTSALAGNDNIISISNTISTITFQIKNMSLVNFALLNKISLKGVIRSQDNITLIIGDCAQTLKEKILELKKR